MSRRQQARARRVAAHWAAADADARTAKQRAELEWARLRNAVKNLPDERRDGAWRALADGLRLITADLTEGEQVCEVHSRVHTSRGTHAQTRPRAREATSLAGHCQ